MPGNAQPLVGNQPIVNSDGTPNAYFTKWAQQRQIDITSGITADQAQEIVQELINEWAAMRQIIAGTGLDGGGDLSADVTLNLADTAVDPGTYGDATNSAKITVDQQGRITDVVDVPITGGGGGGGVPKYIGIPLINLQGSTAFGVNNFGCRVFIMPQDCTIYAIVGYCKGAQPTAKAVPAVYTATAAGIIGNLLAQGPQVTGITLGRNEWPLTTPLAVTAGTPIYVGIQLTIIATAFASLATAQDSAFFASTGALPNPAPAGTYTSGASMSFWARTTP